MRRVLPMLALGLGLALPPVAAARHERVSIRPRVGDVNTRFVYRGYGWRPNARLSLSHGALCGTGPCILPLFAKLFRADDDGRFTVSERPTVFVPEDFVGYGICFGYRGNDELPRRCLADGQITVAPPWASATPANAMRNHDIPLDMTLSAAHFKAGTRLEISLVYPDGRKRMFKSHARRHGRYVGPAAYARRGGMVKIIRLRPSDPDGTYEVRVTARGGATARTSFHLGTYAP